MIRVHIKIDGVETNYLDLSTQAEVDQYLSNIGNHWGRQQDEHIFDKDGALIETLPQQVIFTQEDITAQVEQAAINKASLEYLASTDWMIIREAEGGTPCPAEVKTLRQAARARIAR